MFIIKDGFYANPYEVRDYALSLDFKVEGNYPGKRTNILAEPYFTALKEELEKILNKKISYWPTDYNTSFQITTEKSTTWTHYDKTQWAAVCYLTPRAPIEAGTAIFRHKKEGIYQHRPGQIDFNEEPHTPEDWEVLDFCGNIFNRIVIYEGSLYHSSKVAGFGSDKYDGRLFQTFFFDTEEK